MSTPAEPRAVRAAAGPGETGWAAGLLALGAAALAAGWAGPVPLVVLVVVAAAVVAVVRLAASRVSTTVVVALALALLVVGCTLLLRGGPAAAGAPPWRLLADAVPRLVTGPRPAPADPDLLVPGLLLTGLIATLVGVRLTRPGRRRASPLLGAVLLLAGGAALSAGEAARLAPLAVAATVVAVGGWGLLDARAPGATAPSAVAPRRRVAAVGALAAVAVPLVVGGALLRSEEPFDLRTVVEPPVQDVVVANPMPMLGVWARDPERRLFTVSGTVFPLHLAVLEEYDGAAWSAPSAFRPLGEATAALAPGDRRAEASTRVTLVDLPRPWLPVVGSPTDVDSASALVDADSGSVIDPRARAGLTVTARGTVDAPDEAGALGGGLPAASSVPLLLATPGLPESLRSYAEAAVEGADSPFARAKAVEAAVRGTRTVDPEAPGGSSYRRVETFLLGGRGVPGAQAGTSEQFATSFAVLARAVGLPTRVVVGFTPGSASGGTGESGSPGSAAERTVHGRDALAWPEVYFTGAGWVPFSPTPSVASLGPDVTDQAPIPTASPTPAATPSTAVTVEVSRPGTGARAGGGSLAPVVLGAVLVAVLALAPLVALAALRARRRSGLRDAGAAGAWAQLLDVAALADLRSGPGQDARELATALDLTAGSADASAVLAEAERAVWGPTGTPSGRRGRTTSWDAARRVERAVRRSRPAGRRLAWGLSPRPLRRPRGPRPEEGRKVPAPQRLRDAGVLTEDGTARWAPGATGEREDTR